MTPRTLAATYKDRYGSLRYRAGTAREPCGGQHNWIEYELTVPAGWHTIRATSDTGATTRHQIELPVGETRWAVLDYWYYPKDTPRRLTFRVDDHAIGFD